MGRRSDHTREQLRDMIVVEGHRQLAEVGFFHFSAREVAKRIGYSIGTLYNVFGNLDQLMLAINGMTLDLWRDYLLLRLDHASGDRLRTLVEAYFEFAIVNRHAWAALYDHRLPEGAPMPAFYSEKVRALTAIVIDEVAAALPPGKQTVAAQLTPSLLAGVHGHCVLTLTGTLSLLDLGEPFEAAYARVREALAAA
jgi:AcrR family transcriptional regulator